MKAMAQLLPPVCMCPLSESNNYLKHVVFILKVPRRPRSRKKLLPFSFSPLWNAKTPKLTAPETRNWLITLERAVRAEPVHRLSGRRASVPRCFFGSAAQEHLATSGVWQEHLEENWIIKSPCTMWALERSCYCCISKVQWCLLLLFVKSHSCLKPLVYCVGNPVRSICKIKLPKGKGKKKCIRI